MVIFSCRRQDGDINPAPAAAGSTTSVLDLTAAENIGDNRRDNTIHGRFHQAINAPKEITSQTD